ncbi:uncharacterized protein E0L32_009958 [Thyridium curvatum]|uniref:Uncharacterized protein n=1 Tax=Thyridium curvatum TaxID=1093900 RepID=A0A507AUL5_9PEZI|nr:uncharacterized protein E0L32_009958 [Thyridium curvatum]TPX08619.1 hypothetical protein E0L32_009958 [Thyridium curvatum]
MESNTNLRMSLRARYNSFSNGTHGWGLHPSVRYALAVGGFYLPSRDSELAQCVACRSLIPRAGAMEVFDSAAWSSASYHHPGCGYVYQARKTCTICEVAFSSDPEWLRHHILHHMTPDLDEPEPVETTEPPQDHIINPPPISPCFEDKPTTRRDQKLAEALHQKSRWTTMQMLLVALVLIPKLVACTVAGAQLLGYDPPIWLEQACESFFEMFRHAKLVAEPVKTWVVRLASMMKLFRSIPTKTAP